MTRLQEKQRELKVKLGHTLSELAEIKYALDQTAIVAITDLAGKIIYANDRFCQISKYSKQELLGNTHGIINSGFHPKSFFTELWNTISSGKIWRGEIRNKAKDGSFYWVDTTIIPFSDGKLSAYQYVSIRFDITEKKQIQELIEKERLRREYLERLASVGEMAADIAHEIRNPLSAILLRSQMLKREGADENSNEILSTALAIENGVHRIEKIINSVRSLSRDGQSDPFETVDLKTVINDTIEFSRSRFAMGRVELIIGSVPDNLKIFCRPIQISQVVINLLNNAYDAVRDLPEKWVKLEVIERGDVIVLSVSDSGKGVPTSIKEKIMQPFFTTKDRKSGTGLGLSISNEILKGHGGFLKLDDSKSNTTFLIGVPKSNQFQEVPKEECGLLPSNLN